MNLGKNVYNLLKRQTEVYVKGLGSFKRNHTPAGYDEKRNVYLPPISYIDFDWSSKIGYDFIHYVQQLQLIDRAEAEEQVEKLVDELLNKIREEGQAKLDDLGYLVSYGEGFVFRALDLSAFSYEAVPAMGEAPPEEILEEPVIDEEPVVEEEQQPIAAEILEPEPEPEVRSANNTIWYMVTAIIALGILVALYLVNRNNEPKRDAVAVVPEQDTLPAPVEIPLDTLVEELPLDTLHTATDSTAVVQDVADNTADHTWQIVIGSHKTLAQAYEQAESYNKAGYPRVRVIPSNLAKNRKKVIWDSYATKQQVDSALLYVQKHIIKDAWPDKIK